MANGLNKVMVIGNLGGDPEVKQAGSSDVMNFSIAVNQRYKDTNDEWQDRTEWVKAVLWGRRATALEQYLSKGSRVYIEGRLQTRSWEKDGVTRYMTEVNVQELILLGDKQRGEQAPNAQGYDDGPDF